MSIKLDPRAANESRVSDHYSVKTICQLTGLNEHTLRAWERRYQVVTPERLENGRRVYSLDDLEKLKLVTLLVRKGFLIGNIASGSIEHLSTLVNDAQAIPNEEAQQSSHSVDYQGGLRRSLDAYDLLTLQSLIKRAKVELGVRAFIFDIVISLVKEMPELVAKGQLTLPQESAFCTIIRSELVQILFFFAQTQSYSQRNRQEAAKIFAIGTNQGNSNEYFALIAGVICAFHGFPVYYFGANMPSADLSEAAKLVGANCVILGLPHEEVSQESRLNVESYVQTLKSELPVICQLWVGGNLSDVLRSDKSIRKLPSLIELDGLLSSIRTI